MDPLTLTIVLYLFKSLHQYHISKLSSTPFLLLSISLFVVYTVNLPVVRPWSCRVIYYFDTPALGRRHQIFWSCQVRIWRHQSFDRACSIQIICIFNKTKSLWEFYGILMKGLNKDKTIVNVRWSTNGISNKYSINSFYYLTRNHT